MLAEMNNRKMAFLDCEENIYLIGQGGKLYEYDHYFDVAVEIKEM